MRRHVSRYIAHLHTKPEEERIRYAVVGAAAVTGVIFFIWLMFFFARLQTPTRVVIPPAAVEDAQQTVDRILEEAQYGIDTTQDRKIQDSGFSPQDSAPSEASYPESSNPTSSPAATDDWSADL